MEKKRVSTYMEPEIYLEMRIEAIKLGISFGDLIEKIWRESQAEKAGK